MAPDQQPVTDDELAEAKAELQRIQEQVRHDLAEDLGGDAGE